MSLWRPELGRPPAVVVGLDAQRLAWGGPGAPGRATVHTGGHADLRHALDGMGPGRPVNLVVASDVAMHWVQAPPASVASLHELQLVAQARCAHLYGGLAGDWWVTGDWSASHAFVCAALPRAITEPIQSQLGARARWHTAWGLVGGALRNPFPAQGWSAVRSPERVVVWHCTSGRASSLITLAVEPGASAVEVSPRALQRMHVEAARSGQDPGGRLHWMDLVSPLGEALAPEVQPVRPLIPMPRSTDSEAATALAVGSLLGGIAV